MMCHRFSSQTVFATGSQPVAIYCHRDQAFIATENLKVVVHSLAGKTAPVTAQFTSCGLVKQIQFSEAGNFVATVEMKTRSSSFDSYTVRCYLGWERSEGGTATRIRSALGGRRGSSSVGVSTLRRPRTVSGGSTSSSGSVPEAFNLSPSQGGSGMEVLEFLSLSRPTCLAVCVAGSSRLCIAENAYVHLYNFVPSSGVDSPNHFQHLYTVNFSFVLVEVVLNGWCLGVCSVEEVQIISIFTEDECDDHAVMTYDKGSSKIEVPVEVAEAHLPSITGARRITGSKPKVRPREIFGPTGHLDMAEVALLRHGEHRDIRLDTLLYRKFCLPQEDGLHSLTLVREGTDGDLSLLIANNSECTLYAVTSTRVTKVAVYSFSEDILQVCCTGSLLHFATNSSLLTYTSRLQGQRLCPGLYAELPISALGKQKFIGIRSLHAWRRGVLVYTRVEMTSRGAVSKEFFWSCYSLQHQPPDQIKADLLLHCADFEYSNLISTMHLYAESLLISATEYDISVLSGKATPATPSSPMLHRRASAGGACDAPIGPLLASGLMRMNSTLQQLDIAAVQRLVILCFQIGGKYAYYVCELLFHETVPLPDAIDIIRELESRTFTIIYALTELTRRRLIDANIESIAEDALNWLIDKLYDLSPDLSHEFILSNYVEDSLLLQSVVIEHNEASGTAGVLVRALYELVHSRQDAATTWIKKETMKTYRPVLLRWPHLLFCADTITQFGRFMATVCPQLVAEVLVSSLELRQKGGANLEQFKELGDCTYIILLEELVHQLLADPPRSSSLPSVTPEDELKPLLDELMQLYLKLSLEPPDSCLHDVGLECRKIPKWLLLRRCSMVNFYPPFNKSDPARVKHQRSNESLCLGLCCHSYLVRLQALLSWDLSVHLPNRECVAQSADSREHSAWQSLQFLLVQQISNPSRESRVVKVINFLLREDDSDSSKCGDDNTSVSNEIAERYLSEHAGHLTISDWILILPACRQRSNALFVAALNLASNKLSLLDFLQLENKVPLVTTTDDVTKCDWVELTARRKSNDALYKSFVDKLSL